MKTVKDLNLVEDGTTFSSTDNARKLIEEFGLPHKLDFKADTNAVDYSVVAYWPSGQQFRFIGFAWGYGGTAPAGLNEFFLRAFISSLLVDDIPIDKFGKTDCTWYRDPTKGGEQNILTEEEWRLVHNGLSTYQNSFVVEHLEQTAYVIEMRRKIQKLMDKIRDNYIALKDEHLEATKKD